MPSKGHIKAMVQSLRCCESKPQLKLLTITEREFELSERVLVVSVPISRCGTKLQMPSIEGVITISW